IFQIENVETLPVTAKCIREEIGRDALLTRIHQALVKGKSLVPLGFKDGEFTLQSDIIFRKERVVIPKNLRKEVLKELHIGHFGTVRMKQLSRNFCWWPKIDKDIEEITRNCEACIRFSNNPNSKTKHMWEAVTQPFERVHIDFAGPFMGYIFLVLVDAYTKWPETLVSDNGRTFIAEEFQNFLKNNGIYHKRTAPYHPATNGLAERFVQTLKQALRKLNVTNGNIKTNLQK
ncbi:PREDICTED: uncharacterized protein K02A2.6-like, partial [Cyphomyrmex costatus]|uniref:uncharacterized protein K02A2.6-like n=1 Tax=Cyphomyrmex costatus TaxID=456900 RepID=UPI0008523FB9